MRKRGTVLVHCTSPHRYISTIKVSSQWILTGTLDTLLTLSGNDWDSGYYYGPLVAKKEFLIQVLTSLAKTGTLDTTNDL